MISVARNSQIATLPGVRAGGWTVGLVEGRSIGVRPGMWMHRPWRTHRGGSEAGRGSGRRVQEQQQEHHRQVEERGPEEPAGRSGRSPRARTAPSDRGRRGRGHGPGEIPGPGQADPVAGRGRRGAGVPGRATSPAGRSSRRQRERSGASSGPPGRSRPDRSRRSPGSAGTARGRRSGTGPRARSRAGPWPPPSRSPAAGPRDRADGGVQGRDRLQGRVEPDIEHEGRGRHAGGEPVDAEPEDRHARAG